MNRAGTVSIFWGFKLFLVSNFGPELRKISSSLEILWTFLEPSISYILLSPVELFKKLGKDLCLGSIRYLAYLLQAFLLAWTFKPGRVTKPALVLNVQALGQLRFTPLRHWCLEWKLTNQIPETQFFELWAFSGNQQSATTRMSPLYYLKLYLSVIYHFIYELNLSCQKVCRLWKDLDLWVSVQPKAP